MVRQGVGKHSITGGAERYVDRGLIPRASHIFKETQKRTD